MILVMNISTETGLEVHNFVLYLALASSVDVYIFALIACIVNA